MSSWEREVDPDYTIPAVLPDGRLVTLQYYPYGDDVLLLEVTLRGAEAVYVTGLSISATPKLDQMIYDGENYIYGIRAYNSKLQVYRFPASGPTRTGQFMGEVEPEGYNRLFYPIYFKYRKDRAYLFAVEGFERWRARLFRFNGSLDQLTDPSLWEEIALVYDITTTPKPSVCWGSVAPAVYPAVYGYGDGKVMLGGWVPCIADTSTTRRGLVAITLFDTKAEDFTGYMGYPPKTPPIDVLDEDVSIRPECSGFSTVDYTINLQAVRMTDNAIIVCQFCRGIMGGSTATRYYIWRVAKPIASPALYELWVNKGIPLNLWGRAGTSIIFYSDDYGRVFMYNRVSDTELLVDTFNYFTSPYVFDPFYSTGDIHIPVKGIAYDPLRAVAVAPDYPDIALRYPKRFNVSRAGSQINVEVEFARAPSQARLILLDSATANIVESRTYTSPTTITDTFTYANPATIWLEVRPM